MPEWPQIRFDEISAHEKSSISKPYGSAFTKSDYVPSGVPLVRGVNLGTGRFHDEDFVYITEGKADSLPGANLAPGDLVITHRGTIGQVSMIPRSPKHERYVLSTSQVKARLDSNRAFPEFYYYWLVSPLGQREILQHVSTVGVPGLVQPVATVKSFRVPNPPLWEQKAVASVLGALDDKIAINERIASAADALARNHYERERCGLVGQPKRLDRLARVVVGGTPSRANPDYWNQGTVNWINSGKTNEFRVIEPSELITEAGLAGSSAKMMPPGATLIGITGATMGQISRLEITAGGSQNVAGVWSEDPTLNDWLFYDIQARVADLTKHASGGAQQHINKKIITDLDCVAPDAPKLAAWHKTTAPLMARVTHALLENHTLAALRDTLLPQLMSGRLRVRDAEKIVEDHA
ncbi:restriction endonuclease subunit S [Kitasatospora sp. NPDC001527]|uniref:restriction endonuclease subunit S n=1 Tax=Kitasatospora sp. NPDC001527 TaxID=3154519 RepID=UPI00332E4929